MTETLRIALLGAGQLGGSFVLGLRAAGADIRVHAYDPSLAHAEELHALGGIDEICTSAEAAARGADMVLFASPLRTYRALATAIAPVIDNGCIVTDLGSVKSTLAALATTLPQAYLVPAHPIAGSEKSGASAARADLFKGKLCILTPDESTDENAFRVVEALWDMLGADVIAMPAPLHDQIYAHVSHLPHYIAFLAAGYFYELGAHVAPDETMIQQFLRISRSNPRMWTDVALENREALLPLLATYIALLEHFATELRAGGEQEAPPIDPATLAKTLLPRVLAASLISSVSLYEQASGQSLRAFGGAGMRDVVSPAAITPEADTEAMSHHSEQMANIIEGIIPSFKRFESLLGTEDEPTLYALLSEMAEKAHILVSIANA